MLFNLDPYHFWLFWVFFLKDEMMLKYYYQVFNISTKFNFEKQQDKICFVFFKIIVYGVWGWKLGISSGKIWSVT